jgi:hypothetical protein
VVGYRAHSDAEARLVHHGEYVGDAAVGFAYQITDGARLSGRCEGAVAEVQTVFVVPR